MRYKTNYFAVLRAQAHELKVRGLPSPSILPTYENMYTDITSTSDCIATFSHSKKKKKSNSIPGKEPTCKM